jgi:hypothetical protein
MKTPSKLPRLLMGRSERETTIGTHQWSADMVPRVSGSLGNHPGSIGEGFPGPIPLKFAADFDRIY